MHQTHIALSQFSNPTFILDQNYTFSGKEYLYDYEEHRQQISIHQFSDTLPQFWLHFSYLLDVFDNLTKISRAEVYSEINVRMRDLGLANLNNVRIVHTRQDRQQPTKMYGRRRGTFHGCMLNVESLFNLVGFPKLDLFALSSVPIFVYSIQFNFIALPL